MTLNVNSEMNDKLTTVAFGSPVTLSEVKNVYVIVVTFMVRSLVLFKRALHVLLFYDVIFCLLTTERYILLHVCSNYLRMFNCVPLNLVTFFNH